MEATALSPQMQMLSTNMLLNMRTGNIIMDSMVSMLIAGILMYIVQFKDVALAKTKKLVSKLWCERSCVTLNGKVYNTKGFSNSTSLSENFLAVNDWIAKEIRANGFRNASRMGEVHISRTIQHMLSHSLTMCTSDTAGEDEDLSRDSINRSSTSSSGAAVMLNQSDPIYHKTHDIIVRCESVEKDECEDQTMFSKSKVSYTEHNVHVSSKSMDVTELIQFVTTQMVHPFQVQKREKERNKLYYFLFDRHNTDEDEYPAYERYEWVSTKHYKHIVSEHTNTVKERVDRFLTDRSWYVEQGKPHSLTIMLYGPPGCGKTSIIKAVANHTKRHIKEIPLPRVKSRQTLMEIFHGTRIGYKQVKPQDCIFVFEEFDKMGDVVMNDDAIAAAAATAERLSNTTPSSSPQVSAEEITDAMKTALCSLGTRKPQSKAVGKRGDDDPPLSIGDILNVMDGLLENNGIITFFTANKISHLHEAILRPGRIDLKLKFDKSSVQQLKRIICKVFRTEETDTSAASMFQPFEQEPHKYDCRWSPAEIEEMCFGCATVSETVNHVVKVANMYTTSDA